MSFALSADGIVPISRRTNNKVDKPCLRGQEHFVKKSLTRLPFLVRWLLWWFLFDCSENLIWQWHPILSLLVAILVVHLRKRSIESSQIKLYCPSCGHCHLDVFYVPLSLEMLSFFAKTFFGSFFSASPNLVVPVLSNYYIINICFSDFQNNSL